MGPSPQIGKIKASRWVIPASVSRRLSTGQSGRRVIGEWLNDPGNEGGRFHGYRGKTEGIRYPISAVKIRNIATISDVSYHVISHDCGYDIRIVASNYPKTCRIWNQPSFSTEDSTHGISYQAIQCSARDIVRYITGYEI